MWQSWRCWWWYGGIFVICCIFSYYIFSVFVLWYFFLPVVFMLHCCWYFNRFWVYKTLVVVSFVLLAFVGLWYYVVFVVICMFAFLYFVLVGCWMLILYFKCIGEINFRNDCVVWLMYVPCVFCMDICILLLNVYAFSLLNFLCCFFWFTICIYDFVIMF